MSEGARWRVSVDRSLCVGSGQCAAAAPGAFRLDAVRQSHPVTEETAARAEVWEAAENCPAEAVTIRLCATGEVLFPPPE
ncbi:ferredoxin [Streptomyces sp. NPDC049555]|uniref:ferredoxin n=1 Tax=unclassified Streptomyces TaxID=2593676 RepID=UPI003429402F